MAESKESDKPVPTALMTRSQTGSVATDSVATGLVTRRFLRESGQAGTIAELAEPVLESLGFRLVRVIVSSRDGGTLQIMAERPDGTISIDECAVISRNLSPLLDANDPMQSSYRLEVSSPGIDRPLVRPQDFEDWAGFEARIETKELIDGRRRFRGRLDGFEDGEVRIEIELPDTDGKLVPQIVGLPVGLIEQAKLMLTDDLVRAALKGQSSQEQSIADAAEALQGGDEVAMDDDTVADAGTRNDESGADEDKIGAVPGKQVKGGQAKGKRAKGSAAKKK